MNAYFNNTRDKKDNKTKIIWTTYYVPYLTCDDVLKGTNTIKVYQ